MEITPVIPANRQVIDGYGNGRFRISGTVYNGSVIVFPDRTHAWPVSRIADANAVNLAPVLEPDSPIDILLVGCGVSAQPVALELREALRAAGMAVEVMGTGAACRTYNVLMAEDRRVAAALVAIE